LFDFVTIAIAHILHFNSILQSGQEILDIPPLKLSSDGSNKFIYRHKHRKDMIMQILL